MNTLAPAGQNGHITTARLRQRIVEELKALDFVFDEQDNIIPPDRTNKDALRHLHETSRNIQLQKNRPWLQSQLAKYFSYFANGSDIEPDQIKPQLVQVTDNWHKDLFRIMRLTWSLPYSCGFGRRLRYLILDEHNEKVIGIFALQSPPIHFPARDSLYKYPEGKEKKVELINQTMDIHTLGAIPPYNILLGGKLVALATTCNQVRDNYEAKYKDRKTELNKRVLPAHLVALTTTSAYGRSSIYNRLKYEKELVAESIGFTKGYGNFHFQKLYPIFKEYLAARGVSVQSGYGNGPRRSWQLIRSTLHRVGLSGDLLKHGVQREAFLFPLIENLKEYLEGNNQNPKYYNRPFDDLAKYWLERWMLPRSKRVIDWCDYQNAELLNSLIGPEEEHNYNGRR